MKIKQALLILAFSLPILSTQAQTVTFDSVNAKREFQKHWQLSDKEIDQYEAFMQVEGRFRYPNMTPHEVLAISADSDELMRYYAQKAAQNEMKAVQAQLKFAVMVTEEKTKIFVELEKQRLIRALQEGLIAQEEADLEDKILESMKIVYGIDDENTEGEDQ